MLKLNQGPLLSYKVVFLIYCIFFSIVSSHFLLGDVITPTRQEVEVGYINPNNHNLPIENRKFNDFVQSYVPAVTEHMSGLRSGWLVTWTNNNEAGRPTFHLGGFSSAYPLTWLITLFTQNPWYFLTIFSLFSCFLSGVFIILLCRELNLVALAGLIAGTTFATSPFFMYWLTFPMFISAFCWSAGIFWAVTRLAKKNDIYTFGVLAFCIYSLLMTASPQAVVYLAYLVSGYCMYLIYNMVYGSRKALVAFLGVCLTAVVIGVVLAIPVYLDLIFNTSESARVSTDATFFTVALPKFANSKEFVSYFVFSTVPELFGNPVSQLFPFPYNGLSVTLLVIFFLTVSMLTRLKDTWGWWFAIIIFCLMAFVQPVFLFCVEFLGFNISRSNPLAYILFPATILVAYGVDALVKESKVHLRKRIVFISTVTIIFIIIIGVTYGLKESIRIDSNALILMLLISILLAFQFSKQRIRLLVLSLAITILTSAYPLILHQTPLNVAIDSALVDKVQKNLPLDSRFAVASNGLSVLPPNFNASIGLMSVHSYNSLSSYRYHKLINDLGGAMLTYGRWNRYIEPDYSSTAFWMSNISLMLSQDQLMHSNLEPLGKVSGVYFYNVISRMGESLQIVINNEDTILDKITVQDPRHLSYYKTTKINDKGDLLEYKVSSIQSSVLLLSQKFHRDWHAEVLTPKGWISADTTEVNGVFQGVLLPKETTRVRLSFQPYSRYALIAHFFWLVLIILMCFKYKKYYKV